jgi:hypothetical protein
MPPYPKMNPNRFVDSRSVDPKQMPWTSYSRAFSDADMRDMYTYLSELPVVVSAK